MKILKHNKIITSIILVAFVCLFYLSITIPVPESLSRFSTSDDLESSIDIASFGFKVNGVINDNVTIDLADTTTSSYVVPGSSGVIELVLDATESDVSLKYTLSIDSNFDVPDNMHFYLDDTKQTEITQDISYENTWLASDTDRTKTYYIYWEWEFLTDDTSNTNDNSWQDSNITITFSVDATQVVGGN